MAGATLRRSQGRKSQPRLSFLWSAESPTKCLVTGASANMIGVRATGRNGPYIDLSANASTQAFAVPLPQAKYTVIAVFVPFPLVGQAEALLRTTTDGFRLDVGTSSGAINALRVTNNNVINGPSLVVSVDAFDTHAWSTVTTYDGSTISSWLMPLAAAGTNETIASGTVGSAGYIAPTGTFDVGTGATNCGLQLAAFADYAMPQAQVLEILRDPMRLLESRRPMPWWFGNVTAPTPANAPLGMFDPDLRVAAWW